MFSFKPNFLFYLKYKNIQVVTMMMMMSKPTGTTCNILASVRLKLDTILTWNADGTEILAVCKSGV